MANRHIEALKEGFNVAGLATAVAASAALMFSPVPLLIAFVAEAAYLLFVPDSRWYDERLSRREDDAILKRRAELKAQIFPLLVPGNRARFEQLEALRARLDGLSGTGGQEGKWLREILRKLDFLLEKFLQFAAKEAGFRSYLESVLREVGVSLPSPVPLPPRSPGMTPPLTGAATPGEQWARDATQIITDAYDREAEQLKKQAASEPDASTRDIIERRVQTLGQRREFTVKLGRILANLNHQLHLFEDTFGLISDELMARPPEEILSDIEDVVSQANTMTQVLDEVAPLEQMIGRLKG